MIITLLSEPRFWDSKYSTNSDRWSLNTTTPAFVRLLEEEKFDPFSKIAFIGCGKGDDVIYYSGKGLDVTGFDFSESVLRAARNKASDQNMKAKFINLDLLKEIGKYANSFDYIFEYVTFCAVHPNHVPLLIKNSFGMLKSGGKLISLLFPIEKRIGGPPFGLELDIFLEMFTKFGEIIKIEANPSSIKPRIGREKLIVIKKR
ncbi:MAG: class I SAM-dependent methyltransferase [Melioribacteraceae bacterium]|nr:class I SAM-dependent methyltransferase [Melioribacteraceae bacterium]